MKQFLFILWLGAMYAWIAIVFCARVVAYVPVRVWCRWRKKEFDGDKYWNDPLKNMWR